MVVLSWLRWDLNETMADLQIFRESMVPIQVGSEVQGTNFNV